jgi:peptide deformylase
MSIIRQIAQLGHPVLRAKAQAVADPFAPEIQALVADLLATMEDSGGVGIAAPQVYVPLRVIVIASRPNARYPDAPEMAPEVLINPEIVWASKEKDEGWEGCLSIPGLRGKVARHRAVHVSAMALSAGWMRVELDLEDFPARIFQHEYDHLEGGVFLDRLADTRCLMTDKEYLRQQPGLPGGEEA